MYTPIYELGSIPISVCFVWSGISVLYNNKKCSWMGEVLDVKQALYYRPWCFTFTYKINFSDNTEDTDLQIQCTLRQIELMKSLKSSSCFNLIKRSHVH